MTKLVLIDGNAIMHRAYHALPSSLTTKNGEPINAVYGYVSMLLRVFQDLQPSHIAIAFDRPEPTFRHEAFDEYQSHRPPMEDELSSQFEKAKKVTEAFGIPIFEKAGFEADDVIGTIAEKAVVDEVVIVTGDRDILQLVNEKTKVYLPVRGLSDAKLFGSKEVLQKMKVPPEQIDDYKALVGDQSDNYKGVPGIGPKTAEKLLSEYPTVEDIYAHLDEIDDSTRRKLEENKESAEMSHKLAIIVRDAPIDFNLDDCCQWQIDSDEIMDVFDEFGFKTLRKRVKEVGKTLISKDQMSLL